MNELNPQPQKGGKRWVRILLAVSLAVNLLVAGIFVGAVVSGDGPRKNDSDSSLRGIPFGPYARAFEKDDREKIKGAIEERKDWFESNRKKMREFAAEMAAAVRAEPFDVSALEDIFQRRRVVQIEVEKEAQVLLINRLSEMTFEQRNHFADKLERGLRRAEAKP